jgi:hypothetical protein
LVWDCIGRSIERVRGNIQIRHDEASAQETNNESLLPATSIEDAVLAATAKPLK